MKTTKIYLAKSNRANPNIVAEVRTALRKMPNVEITEYLGGKYSNQPLIESDILLIVPETVADYAVSSINIGKGLNSQIADFPKKDKIFILRYTDKLLGHMICAIAEMQHTEIDMAVNWAKCILPITFYEVENILKVKEQNVVITLKEKEESKPLDGSDLTSDIPTL